MAARSALAFALILMPTAAAAQLSDVGAGVALSILFGGVFVHTRKAYCVASKGPVVRIPTPANGPPDDVVFRQELTPEERRHCADDIRNGLAFGPQVGAVLDVPVGQRLFFRTGVRLLLQWEVGIGVKF